VHHLDRVAACLARRAGDRHLDGAARVDEAEDAVLLAQHVVVVVVAIVGHVRRGVLHLRGATEAPVRGLQQVVEGLRAAVAVGHDVVEVDGDDCEEEPVEDEPLHRLGEGHDEEGLAVDRVLLLRGVVALAEASAEDRALEGVVADVLPAHALAVGAQRVVEVLRALRVQKGREADRDEVARPARQQAGVENVGDDAVEEVVEHEEEEPHADHLTARAQEGREESGVTGEREVQREEEAEGDGEVGVQVDVELEDHACQDPHEGAEEALKDEDDPPREPHGRIPGAHHAHLQLELLLLLRDEVVALDVEGEEYAQHHEGLAQLLIELALLVDELRVGEGLRLEAELEAARQLRHPAPVGSELAEQRRLHGELQRQRHVAPGHRAVVDAEDAGARLVVLQGHLRRAEREGGKLEVVGEVDRRQERVRRLVEDEVERERRVEVAHGGGLDVRVGV